eukprot:g8525.t1
MEFGDYSLPETDLTVILQPPDSNQQLRKTEISDAALQIQSTVERAANLAVTDNCGLTLQSSLSACMDFFFHIQTNSSSETTLKLIEDAWNEDADITLRLIFQLRDIRNGKGARDPFYFCLCWLLEHQFQTLLQNLEYVAKLGRWKDLLELLVVQVMGVDKFETYSQTEKARATAVKSWVVLKKDSSNKVAGRTKAKVFSKPAIQKKEAAVAARKAFLGNNKYHQLHVCVASLFAEALKEDLALMKANKSVSLASKWAPSPGKHHDKFTLIVSTISQLLFPKKDIGHEDKTYAQYVSAARNLYRKVYLSPLRKHSNIIERLMSEGKWADISYPTVPSICMNRNKRNFSNRDEKRFREYLEKVKQGKEKVNASALQPHDLVKQVYHAEWEPLEPNALTTIQVQWDAYVQKLKESGVLSNCLAICDVSGSMEGTPMKVAIALSLLVADLAEEPYKGFICTFSATPELVRIPDSTLDVKVEATKRLDWAENTNVERVFDLILERALKHNLPKESMIGRLFIFSDMQFEQASEDGKTNFEAAKSKFNNAGYDLPQIVFWNLCAYNAFTGNTVPVVKYEENTALISGFSGQLLKLFMEGNEDNFSPISILMKAIESYDFLSIVD